MLSEISVAMLAAVAGAVVGSVTFFIERRLSRRLNRLEEHLTKASLTTAAEFQRAMSFLYDRIERNTLDHRQFVESKEMHDREYQAIKTAVLQELLEELRSQQVGRNAGK